jgi:hypothetical protein
MIFVFIDDPIGSGMAAIARPGANRPFSISGPSAASVEMLKVAGNADRICLSPGSVTHRQFLKAAEASSRHRWGSPHRDPRDRSWS